jgi:YfiH family protein
MAVAPVTRSDEAPAYLTSPLLEREGLAHLFTTRHFPGERAPDNPAAPFATPAAVELARLAGLDGPGAAFMKQVHGALVLRAERGGLAGEADALLTDRAGLPLAVFTADCLPVVIYDRAGGRLAVAHAGWRGTVQSVTRAAVAALVRAGSRAEALVAAVGPSIGPCCYEVDRPVIDRLSAAFPAEWTSWVTAKGCDAEGQERWMLDLWKANEDQLRAGGVSAGALDNLRICTSCRVDLFYSYRRGARGRIVTAAAVPGLRPRPAPAAC